MRIIGFDAYRVYLKSKWWK